MCHPEHITRAAVVFAFACGTSGVAHAQLGVTTFGLQVKPVIPLEFFDPLVLIGEAPLSGSFELTGGLAFGGIVRAGLTKSISLEVGITQIRRRYEWRLVNDTVGFTAGEALRWTGYELPITGLVYIRLGERLWMNNAIGCSIDFYPSNVVRDLEDVRADILRNGWVQAGVVANLGVEYRTAKSGYFYLGATYHRPFSDMGIAELTWYTQGLVPYKISAPLNGSYLTLDLRYFFYEKPDKKKVFKAGGAP